MKRITQATGLSLVELLVYLAILGMLSIGIATSVQYFQSKTNSINQETQLSLESQSLNTILRTKLTGGNSVQVATDFTSPVNGNYCFQISENNPQEFDVAEVTNGANFQYRVTSSTSPKVINSEPKLANTSTLGLGSMTAAASVKRSLSMWVKLANVVGNDRVLFDYSPDAAGSTSYKMVVRVVAGNSVRIDMGMGLAEFVYNVPNIRNGDWHHLVVVADSLTANNIQAANNSPTLYVDGTTVAATANAGSGAITFANNLNYKINIGDSAVANWAIGPVGLWNRLLTAEEIGKLGRMSSVNTNDAFWLSSVTPNISTSATNVTASKTVNARTQKGFLLFKKDREAAGQTYFNIYHIEHAQSCPDVAAAVDPSTFGFKKLSDNTCVSANNVSPLLIQTGEAGKEIGFQWRCNLTNGNQVAQASVVGGINTTHVEKKREACGLPIHATDFAAEETATTNTAFVIIDNFDANVDLMTFENNAFPSQMPATTSTAGEAIAGAPSGTTATWFADAANNVGMIKVVTSSAQGKTWWVNDVFRKIRYKSRSDTYAAERKLVFALGDAWPIKVCPGLGYKASYHFYKLQTVAASTTLQAYQDAYRNRSYFGMTGYLGNMRCENEKAQVSARVLDVVSSNNVAIIGAWATRQSETDTNSSPNFASGREAVSGGATSNDTWSAATFVNPQNMYNVPGGNAARNATQLAEDGSIQWRWIGGPTVDHNVILLTDHTLCRDETTRSEGSKKGCTGMNTITVNHVCPTPANNSPACQLQRQSGGNRQFGWWHRYEPNESGSYIYMGYDAGVTGSNYWDDAGIESTNTLYLLEFGDHPWDAVLGPSSAYKTAHATANDTSSNLDPPNVATKTVKTVNAQYCQ